MTAPTEVLTRESSVEQIAYAVARIAMDEHTDHLVGGPPEPTPALISYVTTMLREAGIPDAEREILTGCEWAANDEYVGD